MAPPRLRAAMLLLFFCALSNGQESARPNFIFIFADDIGFGDLKPYGHPYAITENINRLAREGTIFRQVHMTGNVCPTSRCGIMTSRNPSLFPNPTGTYGFRGVPTVTKLLQNAGYTTGHIGKWNIGSNPQEERIEYGIDDLRLVGGDFGNDPRGREGRRFDAAIDFVTKNRDKSFYLNLWIRSTHTPIRPPDTLVEPFKDLLVDRDDFGYWMQDNFDQMGININGSMQKYLAVVHGMDLNVGRLMEALDELNIANNTVVVWTSDNGPASVDKSILNAGYAGGLRGGKHSFYEGGTRVPFIVRWPAGNVPAGAVNDMSVFSGLDWLPTVCSIAGVEVPWDLIEGEDVSDIWKGNMRSRKNPLFFSRKGPNGAKTMRYLQWKLHEAHMELYNLEADPEERNNVYNVYPEIVDAMKRSIGQWEDTLPEGYSETGPPLPFKPLAPVTVIGPPDFKRGDADSESTTKSMSSLISSESPEVSTTTMTVTALPAVGHEAESTPSRHSELNTTVSLAGTIMSSVEGRSVLLSVIFTIVSLVLV